MTRTDIINFLIEKYNFKSYLEIGVQYPESNFDKIIAESKMGVEPFPVSDLKGRNIFKGTSDEFFMGCKPRKDMMLGGEPVTKDMWDIIFIDGLHVRDQCLADILNSLACLKDGGFILVHDCLPTEERQTALEDPGGAWTGDVWKSIVDIQCKKDVEVCTLDTDWGIGVIRIKPNEPIDWSEINKVDLNWDEYVTMRKQLLNIKSVEQWINSL